MTWVQMGKWHALRKENGNGLMTVCGLAALIGTPTAESVPRGEACPECLKILEENGDE